MRVPFSLRFLFLVGLVTLGWGSLSAQSDFVRSDCNGDGFVDVAERDWFQLLTTVQGVGAKVALAILSVLAPENLLQVVAAADKAAMTQAPGVGPKLATRILNELKGKVGDIALAAFPGGVPAAAFGLGPDEPEGAFGGAVKDAASALVNLGYQPSEALGAVSRAAGKLGDGADVEALIRTGLGELAPAEAGAR